MKKIILIGSEGILGKYYQKKLSSKSNILISADIAIKENNNLKNTFRYNLNLEKEQEIKDFFFKIKKRHGLFDILINNAALTTEGVQKIKKKKINK